MKISPLEINPLYSKIVTSAGKKMLAFSYLLRDMLMYYFEMALYNVHTHMHAHAHTHTHTHTHAYTYMCLFTDSKIPVGTLSKSFQGNFLEAINLTLNGTVSI